MIRIAGIISIIFISFIATLANASEFKGRVFDNETKGVIYNANVKIVELNKVISTDKQGWFKFRDVKDGQYKLVVTHISYEPNGNVVVDIKGNVEENIFMTPIPWVLNDVVVTGTRTPHLLKDAPVQTEVVTKLDFERTGATTVDEALGSSIGVIINEDLSGQGAAIRGIEGDRVLVLVDGERAVGRVKGTIDLSQYSLENVEKIEIVKGTGSTLYGSDAMGGVINIITKKTEETKLSGGINLEHGRYNQIQPSIDMQWGNKKTGVMFGGKFYHTDGFDLIDTTFHTNGIEDIERVNLSSKLTQKLSNKWSTSFSARYMYEMKEWVESELKILSIIDTVDVPFDDEEINKRYESSLSFDYLSGDKYSMKFRLFGTLYKHQWNKYSQISGAWEDTSDTEDIFLEASYTSNYVIGENHIVTYGLDYINQDLTSTELIDSKKADESYASYLQYEIQMFNKLTMVVGSRYDHHSSFGGHFNPSINLMFKTSEQVKFRGFYGRGYRAPSIKEQYFVFDHTSAGYIVYGGYAADPNSFDISEFTDLVQENSINSSISAEFSYGTIGLHRITYFYNHLDNLIDFKLIDFDDGYWRGRYVYQNIESAITQGIEWESRIRLTKQFDFSISYNYLITKDLATGFQLRNRPKHTVKFFLTGFLEAPGLGFSLYGDIASEKIWVPRGNTGGNQNVNDDLVVVVDEVYAPSRNRINVNLFKKFKNNFEIYARFENIFNDVNPLYGYWPEVSHYLGIKYKF